MALDTDLEPVLIGSWSELIPALKQRLSDLGYAHTHIIIRHYDQDRTGLLQETGTDRDEGSKLWKCHEDVCRRLDKEPTSPSRVTYARTLDLSQDPVGVVPLYPNKIEGVSLDYLKNLSTTKGIAVYTPEGISRKTVNEYHFVGDPKDALLAIFLVNNVQSSQ